VSHSHSTNITAANAVPNSHSNPPIGITLKKHLQTNCSPSSQKYSSNNAQKIRTFRSLEAIPKRSSSKKSTIEERKKPQFFVRCFLKIIGAKNLKTKFKKLSEKYKNSAKTILI